MLNLQKNLTQKINVRASIARPQEVNNTKEKYIKIQKYIHTKDNVGADFIRP